MLKSLSPYVFVAIISAGIVSVFQPMRYLEAFAQPGCQTFTQTGKTACGKFLQYWQSHGGLAQQGYPISGEFKEKSDLNGQTYTVQYFERAVFELHPENQPPNDVLLSQLGTFQFRQKYPNGEPANTQPQPTQAPTPGGQTRQFTGNGVADIYEPVTLKAGSAHFVVSNLSGVLQVTLVNQNKNIVAKVADILGSSGINTNVNVPSDGNYLIHVEHNQAGTWSVQVDQ